MSDFNQQHNRAVWFDIPVVNLDRAINFYTHVLSIKIQKETYGDMQFALLEHDKGNGGCLVPRPDEVTADKGVMLYLNVNGRLERAVEETVAHGGKIIDPIHSIGPL